MKTRHLFVNIAYLVQLRLELSVGGSRGINQLSSRLGLLLSVLLDLLSKQVLQKNERVSGFQGYRVQALVEINTKVLFLPGWDLLRLPDRQER